MRLDGNVVKCGQSGTSPYYDSGMCVEKCSSATINQGGVCVPKCNHGEFM